MLNGAQAMVKCLESEGITTIFGYPGVAIAPFYDGLYDSKIEHVLVRQEQAAGHAASGWARISRKPAVCVTTSGPGATKMRKKVCIFIYIRSKMQKTASS